MIMGLLARYCSALRQYPLKRTVSDTKTHNMSQNDTKSQGTNAANDIKKKVTYTDKQLHTGKDASLDVDFYEYFLEANSANALFQQLEKEVKWEKAITSNRRTNVGFGDDGLVYNVVYKGKTFPRKAVPWLPVLLTIRDFVSKVTGEYYNFCIVQRYPNGTVGIGPHRDAEMIKGTTIAGVSLGATRKLTMARFNQSFSIPLVAGSLYVLNPPTNTYWTHCIEPDKDSSEVRISMTFRNYYQIPKQNA